MALKDTVKDPLNWVLLVLALLFGYYVTGIPYWQNYYLKTPQRMTMPEYLANPSHPRAFMFRAFGTPPSSIEVVITGLTVTHVDADSILLEASLPGANSSTSAPPSDAMGAATDDPGPDAMETADAPEQAAEEEEEESPPVFGQEQPPPANQILVAGENMDLLEVSVGQQVDIQVHGLHESPLGWVPLEPDLDQSEEEFFTKEELDALERLKFLADGNRITVPYVETGEMRFADGVHPPGEPTRLADIANDTDYIQTVNRLSGALVDIWNLRLTGRAMEQLQPYFIGEDEEGRRIRVYYNQRLLSEWYWALDRLGDREVVMRGTLRSRAPADLRQLEAEDNVQAVMEGFALLSPDGAIVINLENPAGDVLGVGAGPAGS